MPEYCRRVRERLTTFTMEERRRTLEALDIRVSWMPGQVFQISGRIPIEAIAPNTSGHASPLRPSAL